MLHGAPQSIHSAAFLSSWPAGFTGPEPCFESGFFTGRTAAHVCEFPLSHVSAPLFKKSPYVAPPLQLQATAQISTHSTSPKGKKSFSVRTGYSLSMPLTVLGARISLLDAPIWCCNYECAASCVRAAWVSQTPCILSSLSWLGLGVPCVGLETPAPGGVGATKLRCLSSVLFFASSTSGRVFPLHLIKSLTRWYKASSVLLGFKNSYQLRFCWLFRSLIRRSAENLCWGHEQVGSVSIYSAAIFSPIQGGILKKHF